MRPQYSLLAAFAYHLASLAKSIKQVCSILFCGNRSRAMRPSFLLFGILWIVSNRAAAYQNWMLQRIETANVRDTDA